MSEIIQINHDEMFEGFQEIIDQSPSYAKTSNVEQLNVVVFYVDRGNCVNHTIIPVHIRGNRLTKRELYTLIVKAKRQHSKRFEDLIGIYSYNFNLSQDSLRDFSVHPENYDIFKTYSTLQDIDFERTIELASSHNYLVLIFKTKSVNASTPEPSSTSSREQANGDEQGKEGEDEQVATEKAKQSKTKTHKNVTFDLEASRPKTMKKTT